MVQSQPGQLIHKTLSRKYPSQKELAELLKVKAPSSSPSTTKYTYILCSVLKALVVVKLNDIMCVNSPAYG
jgi:hypothetical protein